MESQLKSQISEAFSINDYPGDDSIVVSWTAPSLQDPHCILVDHETLTLYNQFRGKNWHSLSADVLLESVKELGTFTSLGFRYYIPAFLLYALDDQCPIAFKILLESALLKRVHLQWFIDRVSMLTPAQQRVVADTMVYLFDTNRDNGLFEPPAEGLQFWKNLFDKAAG